jgi:hypothetical protein
VKICGRAYARRSADRRAARCARALLDSLEDQQQILDRLIQRYLDRAPHPYAERCWREAEAAGPALIRFAWAGPVEPGRGHYYCVLAPEFLIEYDNTQDDANHAHSVWRHLRDDWGADLLRQHYASHHAASPAG